MPVKEQKHHAKLLRDQELGFDSKAGERSECSLSSGWVLQFGEMGSAWM